MNTKQWLWSTYFNRKEFFILGGLLIVGLFIRIYIALTTQLWRDETYFFFISHHSTFIDLVLQNYWDTVHPSFYYIIIHFWQKISVHPHFLRSLSLVISLGILYLTPLLPAKLFPKYKQLPYIFLFFYSLSPTQISLNVVVRPYPLVILLAMVSIILFIDIVRTKKKCTTKIVFFACINGLIGYTDYSGIWLVMSYYVTYLIYVLNNDEGHTYRNLRHALALSVLTAIPWLIFFLLNTTRIFELSSVSLSSVFTTPNPIKSNLWQLAFFSNTLYSDLFIQKNIVTIDILSIILILVSMIGIIIISKDYLKEKILIVTVIVFPFISSFLYSILFSPIFLGRNLHIVSFALLIGMSVFITIFLKKYPLISFLIIVVYCVNFFLSDKFIHYIDPPYDWKAIERIIHNESSVTLITNEPEKVFIPVEYYSFLHHGPYVSIKDVSILYYTNPYNVYFINTSKSKNKEELYSVIENYSHTYGCSLDTVKVRHLELTKCIWQ